MIKVRRISLVLAGALLTLALVATDALAGVPTPASVTVTVQGSSQTLLPPTQVTTSAEPVIKDGNKLDSCPGTSALGALQVATQGQWSGPWAGSELGYETITILGETHEFSTPYYWSFWVNDKESAESGPCGYEVSPGDQILFFPACYGAGCPPTPILPLGLQAPAAADAGEPVTVTVVKYQPNGEPLPVEGASVTGGVEPAVTDSSGHAVVKLSGGGARTLYAEAPALVRTQATVCVHNGDDGNCGTTPPPAKSGEPAVATTPLPPVPYVGPFALVAHVDTVAEGHVYSAARAPRLLSGEISSHSAVSSVDLELRREYRGRCSSYEGRRERFLPSLCGRGYRFAASSRASFSYLLPAALAPGRYVLDVLAADVVGNKTTLARGTSRIVFYVR